MKKIINIIIWTLCSLLAVLIIAIAALPSWISTSSGTQTALKWINPHLDGKLTVDDVHLSWFGKQQLKNLRFEDEEGHVIFSFENFETNTTLFYLAFGGRSLNKTVLNTPYLYLASSETKEEKPSQPKPPSERRVKRQKQRISFDDTLIVTNGTVVLDAEKKGPITISDIMVAKQNKTLKIEASTTDVDKQGKVEVDAILNAKIDAAVKITDFPVAILDRLSNSTLYTDAIGPTLNADLSIEKDNPEILSVRGTVNSANLEGRIEGTIQNQEFIFDPTTQLTFTLTPALFKQLIDEKVRGNWDLASKTTFTVDIQQGTIPLNLKKMDFRSIHLHAHAQLERAELIHQTLGHYSLKHFDIAIETKERLEIACSGEIQGREATTLTSNIFIAADGQISFVYTIHEFPVSLVELFSSQAANTLRSISGEHFDLEGEGSYQDDHIETKLTLISPYLHLNGELKGRLHEMHFNLTGTHTIVGERSKILGKELSLNLQGLATLNDRDFSIPFLEGKLFNPYFDIDIRGQIGRPGLPFSLDQVHLIASGSVKKLPIEESLSESALQNALLYLHVDGAKNMIVGKLDSARMDANFELSHFIHDEAIAFDQAELSFTCNLNNFPVEALSVLLTDEIDLRPFLGNTLTLTSKGTYIPQKEPHLSIDVFAQGTGFSASLAIAVDGTLEIKQHRPSYVYWEMTPQRYEALMQLFRLDPETEPTFVLVRPAKVELTMNQLICPTIIPPNLSLFLCQSGIIGDLRIGNLFFRSKQTNESITFQEITGSIKGENFSKAIDLAISGKLFATDVPSEEQSAFSFEGQMLNLWTKEGRFNREGLTLKGELNLDLLPVRQFTGILPIDPETRALSQALLGELVNARIYGEISRLSGPLTVDIKSLNFKATIPLMLHPNAIYLREMFEAEITLTESVNEVFLKDINPLLLTGAYSDHPLKVYIYPEGFVLPIRPYSLGNLQIGKAVIDIGKIWVRNGGQIQRLMQFVNAKGISPDGFMQAWFTPIFMNLQNGVASYKRFDALLANNVHIALWGAINLLNDHVNMTLAIAPTTLYQSFKISGLAKKDMFQVKMRGTTSKLDLDWGSAYSRIAFIIARTAGGNIGSIIGGILEQLIPHLGEEPAPPPTTDPFPWESLYPSEPGTSVPQEAPPVNQGRSATKKLIDFLIP